MVVGRVVVVVTDCEDAPERLQSFLAHSQPLVVVSLTTVGVPVLM